MSQAASISTPPRPPRSRATGPVRSLLDAAEKIRVESTGRLDPSTRSRLGQFLTPKEVASFMASLFSTRRQHIRLLDPGAGSGSLTASFVARMLNRSPKPKSVSVVCYEIDEILVESLLKVLDLCRRAAHEAGVEFDSEIRVGDYIEDRAAAGASLLAEDNDAFDCVILNPPYRKIHSRSSERIDLRSVGIETTNLYTGFMLLAARQLRPRGEFVSISPRSFCNGPYFRPFRHEFLEHIAVKEVHVFESRTQAFRGDDVLQENVIFHGSRSTTRPSSVLASMTAADAQVRRRRIPYDRLVRPDDPDEVIHIAPDEESDEIVTAMRQLGHSLADLGIEVSTGRVVDFRAREHLRKEPERGAVPLIYPAHFHAGTIQWPSGNTRKPNAICSNTETANLLLEMGVYVLVKRFTAKEERSRVAAAVFEPSCVKASRVGFENHLNYFHTRRNGIDESLARGLAVFLNSTLVDEFFRQFSGHTQVNASDLRSLPYPSRGELKQLGRSCRDMGDQAAVDSALKKVIQSS